MNANRKPTKSELEDKIRYLEPYRELAMLLARGEKVLKFESGAGADHKVIMAIGLFRKSGGVCWVSDETGQLTVPKWVSSVAGEWQRDLCPYFREAFNKLWREHVRLCGKEAGKRPKTSFNNTERTTTAGARSAGSSLDSE